MKITAVTTVVANAQVRNWVFVVDEQEAARHPFEQEVLMQWWHQDGAVADW